MADKYGPAELFAHMLESSEYRAEKYRAEKLKRATGKAAAISDQKKLEAAKALAERRAQAGYRHPEYAALAALLVDRKKVKWKKHISRLYMRYHPGSEDAKDFVKVFVPAQFAAIEASGEKPTMGKLRARVKALADSAAKKNAPSDLLRVGRNVLDCHAYLSYIYIICCGVVGW